MMFNEGTQLDKVVLSGALNLKRVTQTQFRKLDFYLVPLCRDQVVFFSLMQWRR